MRYVTTVFWMVIVVLAIVFAILNSHSVPIHFYLRTYNVYFPLLLLLNLALGAIIGIVALMPALFRCRSKIRKLKSKIKQSEQEIQNLRTLPIKDTH